MAPHSAICASLGLPTKTLNVRELAGLSLEWAVCQCEKINVEVKSIAEVNALRKQIFHELGSPSTLEEYFKDNPADQPSIILPDGSMPEFTTNWAHGGPIIARIGIDLHQHKEKAFETFEKRLYNPDLGDIIVRDPVFRREMVRRPIENKSMLDGKFFARLSAHFHLGAWTQDDFMSSSYLEAAMRCYVHSIYGETISVPVELLE